MWKHLKSHKVLENSRLFIAPLLLKYRAECKVVETFCRQTQRNCSAKQNSYSGEGEKRVRKCNIIHPLKIRQYSGKCIYLVCLHRFSHNISFKTVSGCNLDVCYSSQPVVCMLIFSGIRNTYIFLLAGWQSHSSRFWAVCMQVSAVPIFLLKQVSECFSLF